MSEDVNISFFHSLFLSLSLCVSVCVASFLIKMWQYHPCVSEQKTKERRKILNLFCRFIQLREITSGTERNIMNGFAVNLTTAKFPSLCFYFFPLFLATSPYHCYKSTLTNRLPYSSSFLPFSYYYSSLSIHHSTSVARNIPSFLSPMPPDIFGFAVFVVLIIIIYFSSSSYYYCCYC